VQDLGRIFTRFPRFFKPVAYCAHALVGKAPQNMRTTFHVWNVTLEYLTNVSWSYRSQTIFFQCDSLPEERKAFSKRKLSCFHWLCLWREARH